MGGTQRCRRGVRVGVPWAAGRPPIAAAPAGDAPAVLDAGRFREAGDVGGPRSAGPLVRGRHPGTWLARRGGGRLASGDLHLWETGGRVVAVAGHGPRFGSAVRLDPIYTAYEHRGYGYATALVAAVTRSLLTNGATEVVHVTTPANPAAHQRLGFQPVADYVTYSRAA
ncbi:GNAT family N-acetyltransferase [Actinomadura luteofluorescens]|uniref:GNAT family N-acetyltransferase n=1 Tax=Actinomadura luteofluorescens TaxID=46163 RepID=UPI00362DEE58